jgi:hypothetical protein
LDPSADGHPAIPLVSLQNLFLIVCTVDRLRIFQISSIYSFPLTSSFLNVSLSALFSNKQQEDTKPYLLNLLNQSIQIHLLYVLLSTPYEEQFLRSLCHFITRTTFSQAPTHFSFPSETSPCSYFYHSIHDYCAHSYVHTIQAFFIILLTSI